MSEAVTRGNLGGPGHLGKDGEQGKGGKDIGDPGGLMRPARVALETTLLLHGVPRPQAAELARELAEIVRARGATPAFVGVVNGRPVVGLGDSDLETLLAAPEVPKLNTASLGVAMHRKQHGATTVSTTMELAAGAGVRVFATGGLGGVHPLRALTPTHGTPPGAQPAPLPAGAAQASPAWSSDLHLDISADLAAFTRFPVAVVTSGCKSLLDVISTREALETLGVPVVGFRTDRFPAFYLRDGGIGVDARFDEVDELAAYVASELPRTGRGIVVANPIPAGDELPRAQWENWLAQAVAHAASHQARGRDVTPTILQALHLLSGGATLRANLALIRANAALAADVARRV